MARKPTFEIPRSEGANPWALLAQWQQQLWLAWPRVLYEAASRTADGAPAESAWTRQLEALNAITRQATLEQQALIESWQQLQSEFAEYWREQSAELMRRFNGTTDRP
ncbi:MAG: hypothetical protein EPN34_00415 [Burkholderiaceae bacterium]|nr:MAG: hypothetical protein EPN34_00415 [Burkholderiaceae bacterium]